MATMNYNNNAQWQQKKYYCNNKMRKATMHNGYNETNELQQPWTMITITMYNDKNNNEQLQQWQWTMISAVKFHCNPMLTMLTMTTIL